MQAPDLKPLQDLVRLARAATTREELGRLYETHGAGYDIAQDDPGASIEDLRELCIDYAKELADSLDIYWLDIEDPDVSDESRSYGPRH